MHHVLDKHLPAVPESDVAETVADDEFENLDCDGPPCEDHQIPQGTRNNDMRNSASARQRAPNKTQEHLDDHTET